LKERVKCICVSMELNQSLGSDHCRWCTGMSGSPSVYYILTRKENQSLKALNEMIGEAEEPAHNQVTRFLYTWWMLYYSVFSSYFYNTRTPSSTHTFQQISEIVLKLHWNCIEVIVTTMRNSNTGGFLQKGIT
jgi:hypothetical protein